MDAPTTYNCKLYKQGTGEIETIWLESSNIHEDLCGLLMTYYLPKSSYTGKDLVDWDLWHMGRLKDITERMIQFDEWIGDIGVFFQGTPFELILSAPIGTPYTSKGPFLKSFSFDKDWVSHISFQEEYDKCEVELCEES